jgi:hypothetical protein
MGEQPLERVFKNTKITRVTPHAPKNFLTKVLLPAPLAFMYANTVNFISPLVDVTPELHCSDSPGSIIFHEMISPINYFVVR